MSWSHSVPLPPEIRLLRSRNIICQAKELYLRPDVSCGSTACVRGCRYVSPCLRRPLDGALHYFIPDADFLLEFLELMELPEVQDFVLLSSVLEESTRRGGGARRSARLRALYTDVRRSAVQFDDLHCTAVAQPLLPQLQQGATRAQLAAARQVAAAQHFADHIANALPIFIVSDSVIGDFGMDSSSTDAILEVAPGVHLASAAAFLNRFGSSIGPVAALADSLLAKRLAANDICAAAAVSGAAKYAPHLSSAAIASAVESGSALRGRLIVSPRRRDLALVLRETPLEGAASLLAQNFVVIEGRGAINRAVHGDVVAVRLHYAAERALVTAAAAAGPEASTSGEAPPLLEDAEDLLTSDLSSGSSALLASAAAAAANADLASAAEPEGDGAMEEDQADRLLRDLERGDASASSLGLPTAAVVGIDRRTPRELVCSLDEADERVVTQLGASSSDADKVRVVLCVPMDRRFPKVRIRTRNVGLLVGTRFVLRLDDWERASMYPSGHVLRTLGPVQDLKTEIEAVLVEAGAHWQPFCEGALAELPPVEVGAWRPDPEEVRRRRDLRGPEYLICSIDPVGCEDVDDALHARRLPDGGLELGVHIADVSFFVREGARLDGEASSRCTTLYLGPGDRRDMLPSLLSGDICSLLANVDRYANSVVWSFNADVSLRSVWFGRTVIRSRHKLHYHQAQDILDGRPPAPGDEIDEASRARIQESLRLLQAFYRHFREMRMACGALELASAELSFETEKEKGTDAGGGGPREPTGVRTKATIEMMEIVAEMMILANGAVAERIYRAFPSCALLRRHGLPNAKALEQVDELCKEFHLPPPLQTDGQLGHGGSNLQLASWLAQIASAAPPDITTLIKASVTRSMAEAQYFSTGEVTLAGGRGGQGGTYHFGLALEHYTHFTSPIRRYADIVVHRQILRAVQDPGAASLSSIPSSAAAAAAAAASQGHANVAAAAAVMNQRHREAKRAQKLCSELYLLLLMHRRPHVERAVVIGLATDARAATVFLPGYHIRARVALATADGRGVAPYGCAVEGAHEGEFTPRVQVEAPDGAAISVRDRFRGRELVRLTLADVCFVRMSSEGTRSHGPALRVQLVAPDHPEALALVIRELERADGRRAGEVHDQVAARTRTRASITTRDAPVSAPCFPLELLTTSRIEQARPRELLPSTPLDSSSVAAPSTLADALAARSGLATSRRMGAQHASALVARQLHVQSIEEERDVGMNEDISDEEKEKDPTQERFIARTAPELGAGADLRAGVLVFSGVSSTGPGAHVPSGRRGGAGALRTSLVTAVPGGVDISALMDTGTGTSCTSTSTPKELALRSVRGPTGKARLRVLLARVRLQLSQRVDAPMTAAGTGPAPAMTSRRVRAYELEQQLSLRLGL